MNATELNRFILTLAILTLAILTPAILTPGILLAADESSEWIDLSKRVDVSKNTVAGVWRKSSEGLTTDAARSSRLTLPYQPNEEYDFRVKFTRTSGVHSVALMFATGSGQATFEIDAWGQHLAGLQMVNRQTLQNNPTRSENHMLKNGRTYTAEVQVRKDRVRALLDGKLLSEYITDGFDLTIPDLWEMPNSRALGIGAYESATTFHAIEVRPVTNGMILQAEVPSIPQSSRPMRPALETASTTRIRPSRSPTPHAVDTVKRVLIVIANQDFFYREYHDPKRAFERAGIAVDVAAGRKQRCRPHGNSGQQGSGEVMPDFAIADIDSSRYDAIMFSGGWGSSMYQYAFEGSYRNRSYNGDRNTKAAVNKLLGEFIEQDKYVGALCHGVSVLAWARVNGKSLLAGRRCVGSPRQSPAGVYNGQQGQPLSRWNAEVNGARLTPIRSIGDPSTSADDVLVEGKIITGEDDNSAKLFGETLAKLLTNSSTGATP
ncbi:putative cysteine protease YraA [Planctomycetes bacterium CA13]|uniref:Putative cysteine protease YraA n=1 Tax=Novipirellula herctigrandis TaxID=2527986 RepID=A0A5C5Z0X2_9BACT|nr:putative cysteine protease YraA [Planctomycetes bacterium CA13]